MKKRRLGRYICGALVILAATACLWTGFRTRGSIKVKAEAEAPGPEVICYRQGDPLWAGDFLGGSTFTMESSGCLTTCISSLMQLQKVGGLAAGESHPGALNRYFSERQVYDSQGNIQWEALEQALGVSVIRKNAGDMEPDELAPLSDFGNRIYGVRCLLEKTP